MNMCKLLVLAALLPIGCAVHKIQYYQFNLPPLQTAVSAPSGPRLIVGRIGTEQALQDARIRYRKGPNEVGTYDYHRWADPPAILVKEALMHTLQASGRYSSVADARSSAEGDYVINGKLLEFEEVDSSDISTRISLQLNLYDTKSGRTLWSQILSRDQSVVGKSMEDVVQAADRNLTAVLGQAADQIGAAISQQRPKIAQREGASAK